MVCKNYPHILNGCTTAFLTLYHSILYMCKDIYIYYIFISVCMYVYIYIYIHTYVQLVGTATWLTFCNQTYFTGKYTQSNYSVISEWKHHVFQSFLMIFACKSSVQSWILPSPRPPWETPRWTSQASDRCSAWTDSNPDTLRQQLSPKHQAGMADIQSGLWLTYPSKEYESQLDSQYMGNKFRTTS